MRILIIIISDKFIHKYIDNIKKFKKLFDNIENTEIEYACISSYDDFHNYKNIIDLKYTMINADKQFSKFCDFINLYKDKLDHEWFVKIRPEITILDPIDIKTLSSEAINARARCYTGPKKLLYGMSVDAKGWKTSGNSKYNHEEKMFVIDDQVFIFNKNLIKWDKFRNVEDRNKKEDEWFMTKHLKQWNIDKNIIGINLIFKSSKYSGNVNMQRSK